jgi:SAM-dependent methyltransferase
MTAPLAIFGQALRRAAAGTGKPFDVLAGGRAVGRLDASVWTGGLVPGDLSLLHRCTSPALDVGCGAGRLTSALAAAGLAALGVDMSPEAVRQARRRGVEVLCGDVFGPLPTEGSWRCVLLVDGNIGIGGDPQRLLIRCAGLLSPGGSVLAEVRPPGESGWRAEIVLRQGALQSASFPWATVAVEEIADVARPAALQVNDVWTESGRWFVELVTAGAGARQR